MAVTQDGAWLGFCRFGLCRFGKGPTQYDRTPAFNVEIRKPAVGGVIGDLVSMPKLITAGSVTESANAAGVLSIEVDASEPTVGEIIYGREVLLIEHGQVNGVYINRSLKQELK